MSEMTEFQEKVIEGLAKLSEDFNRYMEWMKQFYAFLEAKQPDLEYVDDPRQKPVKKKTTKKIESGKVYNYKYKDGNEKHCKKCDGLISFDDYDKETHPYPTHVNNKGLIIGDGSCPLYIVETIEEGK